MHENIGFALAVLCIPSGIFLLYNGTTTSDMNQVLGGATLLSVGLLTAFLVVKSKVERSRTFR
jgi:uncharacterized membrane protein YdjX (TVP38/TMEM64 family)